MLRYTAVYCRDSGAEKEQIASLTQQTEVPGVKGHVEIFWPSDTIAQNKPKIMSTRELWVRQGSRGVLERLRTGVTGLK